MSVFVRKLFFVLLIFLVSVAPIFVSEAFAVDDGGAAAANVDMAEEAMVTAYEAVLDAEEAGVDVSGLLKRLNIAAEYLAKANVCLRLGDFESAIENADLCGGVVEEIEIDAAELKRVMPQLRASAFLLTMIISLIAMSVIGVGSVIRWLVFRGRYHRRVLETKRRVSKYGA